MIFSQEGHESVNKYVKSLFVKNSQKGGGKLAVPPNQYREYGSDRYHPEDQKIATLFSVCYFNRITNEELRLHTRNYIRNLGDVESSSGETDYVFRQEDWLFQGLESSYKYTMDIERVKK